VFVRTNAPLQAVRDRDWGAAWWCTFNVVISVSFVQTIHLIAASEHYRERLGVCVFILFRICVRVCVSACLLVDLSLES
jgi:hypothetical protein